MERDPDDGTPERPALTGDEREELRARIRQLLSSRAVAGKVRANLVNRLPKPGESADYAEPGLDGMFDDLPLSLRRFLRGPEGCVGSFTGQSRSPQEKRACSRT